MDREVSAAPARDAPARRAPGPVADGDAPRLSVAAVARRLGVAPATLRTWDRRYGLGPTDHAPGRHRRYSADDVARLELMQHSLVRGVSPADAAHHALTCGLPAGRPTPLGAGAVVAVDSGDTDGRAPAGPPAADLVAAGPPDAELVPAGPAGAEPVVRVGGWVLRMPGAGPRARGAGRAALAMDAPALRRLLAESIEADGLVATWDRVARPVLVAVAQRWCAHGTGVEVEHLVSECVTAVYNAGSLVGPVPAQVRPVLLAAMPGERHVLALTVLSAVLAERGVPCRPLGADLPADALTAAVRRTAPAALVLWSQVPGSADPAVLAALPRTRPRFRTFVAGAGWDDAQLAPRVVALRSLVEARTVLSALVLT